MTLSIDAVVKKYEPDPSLDPFFGCGCAYLVWEKDL
jgi:hypothetical protein